MIFDNFLEYVSRNKSANTLRAYRADLQGYARYLQGRRPTAENAQGYIDSRRDQVSNRTLSHTATAIRQYFSFSRQVPPRLEVGRVQRRLPKWLGNQQIRQLMAACQNNGDRALIMSLYGGGLRISEALSLTVGDVDPEGYLRIVAKGNKERRVPVEDRVIHTLLRVASSRGKVLPFTEWTARSRLKELCRKAGIEEITPHALRHSAATAMLEAGADIYTVKEWLGHESVRTTETYLHVTPVALKRRTPNIVPQ